MPVSKASTWTSRKIKLMKGITRTNGTRYCNSVYKLVPLQPSTKIFCLRTCKHSCSCLGNNRFAQTTRFVIYRRSTWFSRRCARKDSFPAPTTSDWRSIEILVPSAQVGRIIGKGGQNVRELQRVTGSVIKLSEQQTPSPSADEEATVHIIGPFFSVQVFYFTFIC